MIAEHDLGACYERFGIDQARKHAAGFEETSAALLPRTARTHYSDAGGNSSQEQFFESPADAIVVAWLYDLLMLLIASRVLTVDGLHCFGSFSQWPLSFDCVVAPLLAGNRQFAAFTLA